MNGQKRALLRGYSSTQLQLHWVITGLVSVQCLLGARMTAVWTDRLGETSRLAAMIEWSHVGIGMLVLLLSAWRVVLRITRGVPPLPAQANPVLSLGARVSQGALIATVLTMSLTGLVAWVGDDDQAATLHRVVQVVLYALIGSHISAALMHHYVLRDGLLTRILKAKD